MICMNPDEKRVDSGCRGLGQVMRLLGTSDPCLQRFVMMLHGPCWFGVGIVTSELTLLKARSTLDA